ncbi:MAG TPA: Rrf2 family transcriptional regulator [Paucimonas sp.]|nr:Rrf2 family transcriptional regulator [Paucimonas sp.]
MVPADNFILGNGALHDRFRLATEILAAAASAAPRALALADFERHTGRGEKDLAKLCTVLERAGLLRAEDGAGWKLAYPASTITLEDVFRCVLDAQSCRGKAARAGRAESKSHDVDLLMMQATMEINQSVFKLLRRFTLDRLNSRASSMASFGSHYFNRSRYDESPDFAFS